MGVCASSKSTATVAPEPTEHIDKALLKSFTSSHSLGAWTDADQKTGGDKNIICFVGAKGSGKSTLLQAVRQFDAMKDLGTPTGRLQVGRCPPTTNPEKHKLLLPDRHIVLYDMPPRPIENPNHNELPWCVSGVDPGLFVFVVNAVDGTSLPLVEEQIQWLLFENPPSSLLVAFLLSDTDVSTALMATLRAQIGLPVQVRSWAGHPASWEQVAQLHQLCLDL